MTDYYMVTILIKEVDTDFHYDYLFFVKNNKGLRVPLTRSIHVDGDTLLRGGRV